MSSIRPDLQIRVVVAGAQPEALNPVLRAIKQAGDAQVAQFKAQGDYNSALQETVRLTEILSKSGAQIAAANYNAQSLALQRRLNAEQARLQQTPVTAQDRVEGGVAKDARNQAGLAKDAGDYTRALNVLNEALTRVRENSSAWYAIQRQIASVQRAAAPPPPPSTDQAEASLARRASLEARLAASEGDLAVAEKVLRDALSQLTVGGDAAIATQTRLNQVMASGVGAATSAESAIARQAVAQGKLARSAGDFAAEQKILSDALSGLTVGGEAAIRVQTALNQSQAAGVRSTEAQAVAAQAAERAISSEALAQARLARSTGDFATEQRVLSDALAKLTAGGAAATTVQTALNRAQTVGSEAAAAQIKAQAAAVEKLNNSTANRALLEAKAIQAAGDDRKALELLNSTLSGLIVNSDAYLRVKTRISQVQSSVDAQGSIAGSVVGGIGDAISGITRATAVTFLWVYAIRQVGGAIEFAFLTPMTKVLELTLRTSDEFRKLDITLSGVVGSLTAAKALRADVAAAGVGLPSTLLEQETAVRGVAFSPSIARSLQDPTGREQRIRELLQTLQGLAIINPEQGLEGAQFSTREALAGQFTSLRRRFNISPEVVAESIGKTQSQLRADPTLVLPALKAFTDTFVGPDTIKEFGDLLSTQANLFKGNIERFFLLIGDKGIYDKVTTLLSGLNTKIAAALRAGSPEIDFAAKQISVSLERVVDAVLGAASAVISGLTGKNVDLQKTLETGDIGQLAVIVADVITALSKLAASIYLVIGDILGAAGKLLDLLGVLGPKTAAETQAALTKEQTTLASLTTQRDAAAAIQPTTLANANAFKGSASSFWDQFFREGLNHQLNRAAVKLGDTPAGTLTSDDVPLFNKSIEAAQRKIDDLSRRLQLQKVVEGTASLVPNIVTQGSPDFVGPPTPPGLDTARELAVRLHGAANEVDETALRVFDKNGDQTESLVQKIAAFNEALRKAYDPKVAGSLGDLIGQATAFTGDGAETVQAALKFDESNVSKSLQRARSEIIQDVSRELGKAATDTIERQGGQLLDSVLGLSRLSEGQNIDQAAEGLTLLGAIPQKLRQDVSLLPTTLDIDQLVPVFTKYAQTRLELGKQTDQDLKNFRDVLGAFSELASRYAQPDALKRFGSENIQLIQDRLNQGRTDVTRSFGTAELSRGQTASGAVSESIGAATEAAASFERRVKSVSRGPQSLADQIDAFNKEYAAGFDPASPDSLPANLERASDANKAFYAKFANQIRPVLLAVQQNLGTSDQDQSLSLRITEFLRTPEKLQDAVDKLYDDINNRTDATRTALIQRAATGFRKQVTTVDKELSQAGTDIERQLRILAQPKDLSDRLTEFRQKAGAVFDPSQAGSVPAILALATKGTSDLAEQMAKAKGPLEDLASRLGSGTAAEALRSEIQGLLQQPGLLAKALADVVKKMREAFPDAFSTYLRDLTSGDQAPATIIRRAQGQVIPGLGKLIDIAQGSNVPITARDQSGVNPLQLVPPSAGPTQQQLADAKAVGVDVSNLASTRSELLPRPQDIEALTSFAKQYAEELVKAHTATSQNQADLIGIFQRLKAEYENPDVQAALNLGPEAAQAIVDRLNKSVEGLTEVFAQKYAQIRQITDQFEADLSGSFKSSLADSLVASMNGASNQIGAIFANLGKMIEQALANAVIEATIIRGLINPALNYAFYGSANPVDAAGKPLGLSTLGYGPTQYYAPGSPGSATFVGPPAPVAGNATGGVYPGSLMVMRAAAGILTSPNTMVHTVEDGLPEAIVPIGRGGVPVRWLGNGPTSQRQSRDITIINTLDAGDVVARGVASRPGVILNPVNADMRGRGATARTVRQISARG